MQCRTNLATAPFHFQTNGPFKRCNICRMQEKGKTLVWQHGLLWVTTGWHCTSTARSTATISMSGCQLIEHTTAVVREGHCYEYSNIQCSWPPSSPHLTPRDCQHTFLIRKERGHCTTASGTRNTDKSLGRNELLNARPV
jgi:hypothetical protein